MNWLDDLA